jgi:hypothetical protein
MNLMDNNCAEYVEDFQINKTMLEIYKKINQLDDIYYKEIHIFLNNLFNSNSKSILKLQTSSINLNENTVNNYNNIIKKYKLTKPLFDVDKFDFDEIYDFNCIIEIATTITNNLLHKINYKMIRSNKNNKIKLFITKNKIK